MRLFAATSVALMLACAIPSARADDASRLKLAHEVVEVSHSGDNMRAVMPTMVQQMRMLLTQQGTTDQAQVDDYLHRFEVRFDEEIPAFTDLVAKVYAREFTEEDLSGLLTFYRTPTGQHLLAKQSEIAKGLLVAGQEWGRNVAQQILAEIQKEKAAAPSPKL